MTIDVEGCAFYHPEYNEDCHIGLVFANEYTGGGCTYHKCEESPNCYYKKYYRAVGKLRRIEKLLASLECKQPETCWMNTENETDDVLGCEPNDSHNIFECPSKVANTVLNIINEKEEEND